MNTVESLQNEIEEYGKDLKQLEQALKRNSDVVNDGMRDIVLDLSKKHEQIKEKSAAIVDEGGESISLVQSGLESAWVDFKDSLKALKSSLRGMT